NPLFTFYFKGKGEGELHITSAEPLPFHRHRRLSAGDQADGLPRPRRPPLKPPGRSYLFCKPPAHLPCLSADLRREERRFKAKLERPSSPCLNGAPIAPDDSIPHPPEQRVAFFRCFRD